MLILNIICLHAVAGSLDSEKRISLQFEEVPIYTVLNMIAEQYNLNLVQSGMVEGNISIRLQNVGLEDALQAILASNGYNYYLAGDIIVVKPLDMAAVGETTAKTVTLDYISPSAAVNAVSDMLSSKGKIRIIEEPRTDAVSVGVPVPTQIAIVDLPEVIDNIMEFIRQIDQPEPLVAIEVRIVETNIESDEQIGFKWPTGLVGRVHGITTTSSTTNLVDDTEAAGQIDLPDGKWEWGTLSLDELRVVLDFLESTGNSKLISDPRITTLNNHEAEIKVTTVVPIQTINRFSEGGAVQDIVTFQDEEVGITLQVTPHIAGENEIVLDVNPTVAEIIGFSGPPDNQKPITSERSVRTRITVKNDETAVLGGLLKENKIEQENKIFFLGSLPIIGNLFRHKSVQRSTTDLMILITPSIIKN